MIKRVWNYLSKYKGMLFLTFACSLLGSILALVAPRVIGKAIDSVAGEQGVDMDALVKNIGLLLLLYLSSFILTRYAPLLANKVANFTAKDIRKDAFEKLHNLPVKYFDTHKHGDIISILSVDIENMTEGLLGLLTQMLTGIITVVGTLVFLAFMSPFVAFAVLLITPLSIIIAKFITSRSSEMFKQQQSIIGELGGLAEESISGMPVIKTYLLEDTQYKKFEEINARLYKAGQKAQFYSSLVNPTTRFVNHISYIAVGVSGGWLAINGSISVGQIAAMLSYATQFAKPINEITGVTTQMQNAIASLKRVFSLIDADPEKEDASNVLEVKDGTVSFQKVSFSYDSSVPLIKDLNIDVSKNNLIAIVGPTGAGESTMVNLLMRFYDIDEGRITIDGTDIFDVTRDSLRKSFAMVMQDVWIFKGTVFDNIAFGKPDATLEEVVEAAKNAHIHSFIETLPKGYDTVITQEDMSVGQLQLLTIARAMLVNPPMLILDEATSSVDTRTEQYITRTFNRMMKGRTSFVIAHRLSTIKDADIILVMKDGSIVEKGNHVELMKKKGMYYDLYKKSLTNISN
ncbi:MAG: ABC transporter ATP-binding protein [Clostridiaceae bacterium]|nr:ABC transporter ATP-binding protein [Clostridiaceae bacterium]